MGRPPRFCRVALLALLSAGCAPAVAPPPVSQPVAPDPAASPGPPPPAVDPVYEALRSERERQGLRGELAPLLGKSAADAAQISPVFAGEAKVTLPAENGGSVRLWRRDGAPWILQVDAAGIVVGYDIPSEGIAGRASAAVAAPRDDRREIVAGLDGMAGLPIDSLIDDGFTPVDRAKLPDGGRIYTFRTPEGYFLCLGTDADGIIRAWSTNLPGLERPLRSQSAGSS